MKSTHTYEPLNGRIGRHNNIRPFTHHGTLEQTDQAWLQYVRTFLADPDAELRLVGHPDASTRRVAVITREQVSSTFAHDVEDTVATFFTHSGDPTCNGRYDEEGNRAR